VETKGSEKRAAERYLVRSFKIGLLTFLLLTCSSHHTARVSAAVQSSSTKADSHPRRVLLLHSFGREFAPYSVFTGIFRTELAQQMGSPIEYFDVALESARFDDGSGQQDRAYTQYIQALFANGPPDLVVSIGGPAARFVQRNRRQLFMNTAFLIGAVDDRHLNNASLTNNDSIVAVHNDPSLIIENILLLLPQTQRIEIVLGNSPLEKLWVSQVRQEFARFGGRVEFEFLNDLSFSQMKQRIGNLPPNSAIFFGQLTVDAAGVPHEEEDLLDTFHSVANAPIFGMFDYQLPHGIVGGSLISIQDLSTETASVARRILMGESPKNTRLPVRLADSPRFNAAELQRWNIPENRLPPGSAVLLRQPTFWQLYGWHVGIVAGVCVVEAFLIAILLRSRRRLRGAESLFRTVTDAAPALLWMSDTAGRRVYFNQRWLDFTGRSAADVLGDGWFQDIHPDDRPRYTSEFNAAFEARQPFVLRYRLRRADGQYRWMTAYGVPRHDAAGQFAGYIGSSIDETDLKTKQDALLESETRLRAILDTSVEAILTINPQGVILSANLSAYSILDYRPSELLGRNIKTIIPEPFRDQRDQSLSHCIAADQTPAIPADRELSALRKDGTSVPIELAVREVTLGGRKLFTAFIRDITHLRQAELAHREHKWQLIRAQEDERARVARDLHDDIVQRLAVLALDIASIERAGPGNPFSFAGLAGAHQDLANLSHDVHSLAYQLHPTILEDLGLAEAIKTECQRVARRRSMQAEVKLRDLPPVLSRETSICFFRVAQEALRNVERHSKARAVEISLAKIDNGLQLAVHDDGIGFNASSRRNHPSLGLSGMRERMRLLGG